MHSIRIDCIDDTIMAQCVSAGDFRYAWLSSQQYRYICILPPFKKAAPYENDAFLRQSLPARRSPLPAGFLRLRSEQAVFDVKLHCTPIKNHTFLFFLRAAMLTIIITAAIIITAQLAMIYVSALLSVGAGTAGAEGDAASSAAFTVTSTG